MRKKGHREREKLLAEFKSSYLISFGEYRERGIKANNLEELNKIIHAVVCADLTVKKSDKEPPQDTINVYGCKPHQMHMGHERLLFNLKKLTYEERKNQLIEGLTKLGQWHKFSKVHSLNFSP
ncbi:large ribosomal subunit protein uL18-like [Ziziphus jujuba]|uniref:Large ribosomal subunit protein uL18-like n=1 Tax=Ziziphus jujuba TaxID=326968 RepID=A0ABM4A7Y1_ZIZJJ|nr:large ribosomal subunit protein uL18-like [Ziziphus jujuba]